jgi:hypothetical protein
MTAFTWMVARYCPLCDRHLAPTFIGDQSFIVCSPAVPEPSIRIAATAFQVKSMDSEKVFLGQTTGITL